MSGPDTGPHAVRSADADADARVPCGAAALARACAHVLCRVRRAMACPLGDARLGTPCTGLCESLCEACERCVVCCPVRGLCRVQWIQLWLDLRYQEGSRGDATVLNLEASRLYTPHVVDTRRSLAPRCLYDHVSATSRSVIARRVRYRWPIHTYAFIYRGNPMLLDACQIRSNNCKRSLTRPRFRRRPPFGLRERRGAAAVVFGQRLARHELK